MTDICVSKLVIIGLDNGLLPGQHQPIVWTNAGLLLITPLGSNFSEILIDFYIFIQENAFENVIRKFAAILSRPHCIKRASGVKTIEYVTWWPLLELQSLYPIMLISLVNSFRYQAPADEI